MKRLLFVLVLGAGFALAGSFATASAETVSLSERIAQHKAEVEARIACHRAKALGESCEAAAEPAPAVQAAPEPAPQQVAPPPNVPTQGKAIEISISEQRLRTWEDGEVVMDTPVSTGSPGRETPTGNFEILSKTPNHWSTQYHVDMPWAMRVVRGIFIHELPIDPEKGRLGENDLGRAVSGGCIRVGIGPAEALYRWTEVGTPVIIH